MTRRVLVTGAAGFLAGHLAAALRAHGDAFTVGTDRVNVPAGRWDVSFEPVDLLAPDAMRTAVAESRPDEVYHLIGAVRGSDDEVLRSNAASAELLLDAVRRACPAATVVLVGSAAEYGVVPAEAQPVDESWSGTPTSPYGRAKVAVTALARGAAHAGLRVMVARPFNPVGRGIPDSLVMGAVVRRVRTAMSGPLPRRIAIGTTDSVRDFVDARDVGHGLVAIARHGTPGAAYNLCTGAGRSVSDAIALLKEIVGEPFELVPDPALVRAGEVSRLVGSPARAHAIGWRAERSLRDSLRDAWDGSAGAAA